MSALTPADLARTYGDGWRFDERDGIWIAVDRHGTRYEADDASAPAELREAAELLRDPPEGEDPALDAHWSEKGAAIEARVRAVVAAKGGPS